MRILHVITTLQIGGAERLMVDLLPLLQEMGNEVDLLLFNGFESCFKNELSHKNIRIFSSKKDNKKSKFKVYNPLNIFKLRKYLKRYDIIHTHNTACQVYAPIAKLLSRSKPILVTTEHNSTGRRRSLKWFRPIDRWVYGQYDAIVCIADQTRINFEKHIGRKEGVYTIYNGIDTSRFDCPIKDVMGQKDFVITMVAGFRPQKDQDTLLRAVKCLPDNYRLQFVGEGDREDELKQMCNQMRLGERVTFLGVRMDVPEIMRDSDILVLSSHWEGLSLASIEGMASGRPFIASDVDGLREMVDGAGVLFPEGDEEALANSIQQLCENPALYREVATACQKRAKEYDISVMAEGYHNLYKSLLEQS